MSASVGRWCEQEVIAEEERLVAGTFVAGHPIHARRGLHEVAGDFVSAAGRLADGGVDGGVLPDVVEHPEHAFATTGSGRAIPSAAARPSLMYSAAPKIRASSFYSACGKACVSRRKSSGSRSSRLVSFVSVREHVFHAAFEQRAVRQVRGEHHERVIVGGGILRVPEALSESGCAGSGRSSDRRA